MRLLYIVICGLLLQTVRADEPPCFITKTNTQGNVALSVFLPKSVLLGRTDNLTVEVKNGGKEEVFFRADRMAGLFNLALIDESGQVVQAIGPIQARGSTPREGMDFREKMKILAGLVPGNSRVLRAHLGETFDLEPGGGYRLVVSIEVYDGKTRRPSLLKIEDLRFAVQDLGE